ncbi:glycosyl hydrolase 115 family protein [Botrimarina sp.]|uniref:glycosyl hydrolase 115 family protein n=1 Tax=Botrimarina sp. TaxID=2795802 RepID=UPI0032ED1BA2
MLRSALFSAVVAGLVARQAAAFSLISGGDPAAVWVDPAAPAGVKTVAGWFADDLERVCGTRPQINDTRPQHGPAVLVGVVGSGGEIDRLAESGRLDVSRIGGQREASITAEVASDSGPLLVIAGSDKRGAIYGLLDLSRRMGVSPWYWWADVPVGQRTEYEVGPEPFVRAAPKVRYRGIFLNDEAPALAGWAHEKFGGCNAEFYSHVFELILRLRGNFLWPAMWGRSLFDDDPESQRLADELGVVLSTSHHEPMQRAHVEWGRYGEGPWDYDRNPETLRRFWREGIRRMGDRESVVTLGMRGDGDTPMSDEANIDLLERIVRDQRQILAEEMGRNPDKQPQVWALYKEVQEYYDRGMRVPDDVILLLCDDNWGNVRRLPRPDQARHPGGYGMYYHFDYVGDPRNYKWLNTNSLPRVWEQMRLTWEHGVDQIWVVNVGDLKPMEEPIDFFLTMAYDPNRFPPEEIGARIDRWRRAWAEEQFGRVLAEPVAGVMKTYARLAARRKPELLDASTYSLENHGEWDRVVQQWRDLMRRATRIEGALPPGYGSAYYQLVLHPVLAMGNVHEMYYSVAKNHALAEAGDPAANEFADAAERYYARDAELTARYHGLENGKWNHMMSQTHIGYTNWQQPDEQSMPEVGRVEGRRVEQPGPRRERGRPSPPADATGFVERDNYVAMDATSYAAAAPAGGVRWVELPDHGRAGSAMTTIPVTAPSTPAGEGPCLEYPIWLTSGGPVTVDAYLSTTHDFYGGDDHGIRFAVSIDDGEPVVVDMHEDRSTNEHNPNPWRRRVGNAIHVATTPPIDATPGAHNLRFWRIDTGAVLQKLVVKAGPVPDSYLGPPESERADAD